MRRGITTTLVFAAVGVGLAGCTAKVEGTATMGTFTCRDVQKQECIGPTDKFEATVDIVHILFKTKEIPKPGAIYVIQWIAEDVGAAAPANTVIATVEEKVDDDVSKANHYVLKSHLTKPTKGWPAGKYRVEVKVEDKLATTARFSIE